jgi:hypothetical protein
MTHACSLAGFGASTFGLTRNIKSGINVRVEEKLESLITSDVHFDWNFNFFNSIINDSCICS